MDVAFGKQLELYRKLGYHISESQILPGLNNPKVFVHGHIRGILIEAFAADPATLPMPVPMVVDSMGLTV